MKIRIVNLVSLLCWLACFCLRNSASPLTAPNGVGYEVIALMGIKELLVDPHGVMANWDGFSPDPCSWNTVTCSPDGLVIALGIPGQDLSGTVSPSIGNLTNIRLLLLQNNNISGDIPSEIGSLSKLGTLDLSNNGFSGQIPTTLSHLNGLHYMRLANNSLSGEIPSSLSNMYMTQLRLLDLSFNNLSGQLPIFPTTIFKIEGNPYICRDGDEKSGCSDKGSLLSSSKAKPKLKDSSQILCKSGIILYVLLMLVTCM